MEGVNTRLQIDCFRLISFGSPAFYCLTLRFVAFENLNLSASNLSTAQVDLTEGNGFRTIVLLVSNRQN